MQWCFSEDNGYCGVTKAIAILNTYWLESVMNEHYAESPCSQTLIVASDLETRSLGIAAWEQG